MGIYQNTKIYSNLCSIEKVKKCQVSQCFFQGVSIVSGINVQKKCLQTSIKLQNTIFILIDKSVHQFIWFITEMNYLWFINMVVRVDWWFGTKRYSKHFICSITNHLITVHIALCTWSCLPHYQWEMVF